jgi:hypothetical protein
VIASSAFYVLDGILGWPVSLYDGSWSQWGQMSNSAPNGGTLTSSKWATDLSTRSEGVVYNHATKVVELLTLDGSTCSGQFDTGGGATYTPGGCSSPPESDASSGNQIEEADATYMGH